MQKMRTKQKMREKRPSAMGKMEEEKERRKKGRKWKRRRAWTELKEAKESGGGGKEASKAVNLEFRAGGGGFNPHTKTSQQGAIALRTGVCRHLNWCKRMHGVEIGQKCRKREGERKKGNGKE